MGTCPWEVQEGAARGTAGPQDILALPNGLGATENNFPIPEGGQPYFVEAKSGRPHLFLDRSLSPTTSGQPLGDWPPCRAVAIEAAENSRPSTDLRVTSSPGLDHHAAADVRDEHALV